METSKENKNKINTMAKFSILLAIEAIFCFTPLGSLPAIGPIVTTLSGLPVIITALALGTYCGCLMGFFFGLFSFLVWTFMPPLPISAFLFTPFYSFAGYEGNIFSLLICFVPRILIGFSTSKIYKHTRKASIASAIGSLTNTILVLGGIALFFKDEYEQINGNAILYILGITLLTSGIPEAIIAFIVCPLVSNKIMGIKKYEK